MLRAFFADPEAYLAPAAIWLLVICGLAMFWNHGFPWLARVVGQALGWN